jgi:HPt (histidine-containing phosphotransfer) domain-containing protein
VNERKADLHAQLQALQQDYAARLPGKAAEISTRYAALRDRWNPVDATELRRLVHNLAGSGASYGFPEVSGGARQVERALDAALAASPATTTELDAVGEALRMLIAAVGAVRPG